MVSIGLNAEMISLMQFAQIAFLLSLLLLAFRQRWSWLAMGISFILEALNNAEDLFANVLLLVQVIQLSMAVWAFQKWGYQYKVRDWKTIDDKYEFLLDGQQVKQWSKQLVLKSMSSSRLLTSTFLGFLFAVAYAFIMQESHGGDIFLTGRWIWYNLYFLHIGFLWSFLLLMVFRYVEAWIHLFLSCICHILLLVAMNNAVNTTFVYLLAESGLAFLGLFYWIRQYKEQLLHRTRHATRSSTLKN